DHRPGRRPGRATARPRDYGRLPRGARRARQARGSLGQILPNVAPTARPPEGVSRGTAVVAMRRGPLFAGGEVGTRDAPAALGASFEKGTRAPGNRLRGS